MALAIGNGKPALVYGGGGGGGAVSLVPIQADDLGYRTWCSPHSFPDKDQSPGQYIIRLTTLFFLLHLLRVRSL